MAKSARSTQTKVNNQRLKSKVFGPVEDARTERLSAKLLELAAAPRPVKAENEAMAVEEEPGDEPKDEGKDDAMEMDTVSKSSSKKSKNRVHKHRRAKPSIVFTTWKKGKKVGGKKK